jgi:sugar/nucleoside kinase (ribokinase family)
MTNLLLIGPVTKDVIRKGGTTYRNTGGAVYYQSSALVQLGAKVTAVVTLSPADRTLLNAFHPDTDVVPVWTTQTMEFENNYPDPCNPNFRTQQARIPDNPILPEQLQNLDIRAFDAIYILPLCPGDIPLRTVQYAAAFRKPVFVGAQGYLRHLHDGKVVLRAWPDFPKFAPAVGMLFVDDVEARCIQGKPCAELSDTLSLLGSSGIGEVVVTRGDRGAIIVSGGRKYAIPAFAPDIIADPTGLGDTYMAAYTLQRLRGCGVRQAGETAAATATMKLEYKGAFRGSFENVEERMKYVREVVCE